jgi:hypothetical protein
MTPKKVTTEDFIRRAKEVHGNKYNYSETEYVKIGCLFHNGEIFEQTCQSHLAGSGCQKCAALKQSNKQTLTREEFIKKANDIHNNKYNYDKVDYKHNNIPVIITCKIHGDFNMKPHHHIIGRACYDCGIIKWKKSNTFTTEEFILKSNKIHGYKYNYDNVIYENCYTKVEIICKLHGIFTQDPHSHTSGNGCPKCSKTFSKVQIEWLNYLEIQLNLPLQHILNIGEYKIKNSRYRADGYNLELNIIFEFLGCYFHFCNKCFSGKENDINKTCNKTFQELYENTVKKKNHCLKEGYKYVEIWECEWKAMKKSPELLKNYIDNLIIELTTIPKCKDILIQTYNEIMLQSIINKAQTRYINEKHQAIVANY